MNDNELAQKTYDELVEKFRKNSEKSKVKYAVFSIPIVNGKIILAKRNTAPQIGLYSAIGGKVDPAKENVPDIPFPMSGGSYSVMNKGYERLKWTGIRELIEELYHNGEKLSEKEISGLDLTRFNIEDHSTILDTNTGIKCNFKVITLPERFIVGNSTIESNKFVPSKREVGDISELLKIDPGEINPLTKLALYTLQFDHAEKFHGLLSQIPEIKIVDGTGDNFRYIADIEKGEGFYLDYWNQEASK